MSLLAAFNTLLYCATQQEDCGSPIANRNRAEIEDWVFINTLVMDGLSGNPSFRELLGRVRKVTLELMNLCPSRSWWNCSARARPES